MKFIDIEMDGLVVRARMNEDLAPQTVEAIWNALPFGGHAVHAQISGDMFRMQEAAPVGKLEPESAAHSQHKGSVIFHSESNEICFSAGNAEFSAAHGRWPLTPLADLEPDFAEWVEHGNRLHITGRGVIEFRKAVDQETPFRYQHPGGKDIELAFGDSVVRGALLGELSDETVAKLSAALPVSGIGYNSTWAGAQTILDSDIRLSDAVTAEKGTTFHFPGYLYVNPVDGTLVFCYRDATFNIQGVPQPLIPIARMTEDLDAYIAVVRTQTDEGAKPFTIRFA